MNSSARYYWKSVPFLRLGIPWVAGVSSAHWLPSFAIGIPTLIGLGLLCLALEFVPIHLGKWLNFCRGIVIVLTICFAGYLRTASVYSTPLTTNATQQATIELALVLEQPFQPAGKGWRTVATKVFVGENGRFSRFPGKMLLYSDSPMHLPEIGSNSVVLTRTRIQALSKAANPGAFDAADYYRKKQIFFSCQIKHPTTRMAEKNRSTFLSRTLQLLQQFCLKSINRSIDGKEEQAIAAALLIGYKPNLPEELIAAYRNTGIVHIIAISGMHLALLFGLLHQILRPLRKKRLFRHFAPVVLLLSAWLFTLLTGASPSILRAAIIGTLLVLSEWWGRTTNPINSLAAAAMCLLIFDPWLITDAGFQLSFAAVTGIMLYSRPLSTLFPASHPIPRVINEMISVTLAAQLLTFPLLLFHFHRFPLLFLFTNLIAVPLSTLILYLLIALILFQPFPPAAEFIGTFTEVLIGWMNQWTIHAAKIPGTSLTGLYLSVEQTLLLLVGVFLLGQRLVHFYKKTMLAGLACILLVAVLAGIRQYRLLQQHKLIVYHLPRRSAIHLLESDRQCLITGGGEKNPPWAEPLIATAEWYYGAGSKELPEHTQIKFPLIRTRRKLIALIDGRNHFAASQLPPKADVVVLMQNPAISLKWLAERLQCPQFVLDGSNRMWKIREWKKEASQLHLQCHFTPEQGAFIINL